MLRWGLGDWLQRRMKDGTRRNAWAPPPYKGRTDAGEQTGHTGHPVAANGAVAVGAPFVSTPPDRDLEDIDGV